MQLVLIEYNSSDGPWGCMMGFVGGWSDVPGVHSFALQEMEMMIDA